jgi:DMSO reductase anchor subunit
MRNLAVDVGILTVFSVAFLGTAGFMFYLVVIDKSQAAEQFAYPLATAILGFLTGYFAGSRGGAERGK